MQEPYCAFLFLIVVASDVYNSNGTFSTGTQTWDEDWIENLKEQYAGVEIKSSENIQCRLCLCVSVQAISIYDKCNSPLQLEKLINSLLPIKVNNYSI